MEREERKDQFYHEGHEERRRNSFGCALGYLRMKCLGLAIVMRFNGTMHDKGFGSECSGDGKFRKSSKERSV